MLSPRDQIVESIEIGRKADRNPRIIDRLGGYIHSSEGLANRE
jgi:hypothetical protein